MTGPLVGPTLAGPTLACAVLTAVLVTLLRAPRPRCPDVRPSAETGSPPEPHLSPQRVTLALLAGAGGALLVPGPGGAVAGVMLAVLAWRRLGTVVPAAVVRRRRRVAADLPVAVDLLAGALRAGADPATALTLVSDALPGALRDELRTVLARLAMGTDPAEVWTEVGEHPRLGPLGRALARAHRSGSSVVVAAERLAAELRDEERMQAEARARSVSTYAAAPLGLCFLPAFVLLGIVPLVAGMVTSLRWP